VVSEFGETSGKLGGRTLGEAVEGYLRTVATVKRKDIAAAVEEFIQISDTAPRFPFPHKPKKFFRQAACRNLGCSR
jgi:hypothetical protein